MVQIFAPKPVLVSMPAFYNVDTSVGRGGQNSNSNDIMLVQYFLSLIGKNPGPETPASLGKVKVTGQVDAITIAAIEDAQTAGQLQRDGRVSVAKGYKFGSTFYTIVSLNFSVRGRFKTQWPNVDKMPACPGPLIAAVRAAIAGTGG